MSANGNNIVVFILLYRTVILNISDVPKQIQFKLLFSCEKKQ